MELYNISETTICKIHSEPLYYKCCGIYICEQCNLNSHIEHKDKISIMGEMKQELQTATQDLSILKEVLQRNNTEIAKLLQICTKSEGAVFEKMTNYLKVCPKEIIPKMIRERGLLILNIKNTQNKFIKNDKPNINKILIEKQKIEELLKIINDSKGKVNSVYIDFMKKYIKPNIVKLIEFEKNDYYGKAIFEMKKCTDSAMIKVEGLLKSASQNENLEKEIEKLKKLKEGLEKNNFEILEERKNLEKENQEIIKKNEAMKKEAQNKVKEQFEKDTKESFNKIVALKKECQEILNKNEILKKEGNEIAKKNQILENETKEIIKKNDMLKKEGLEISKKNEILKKENLDNATKNKNLEKEERDLVEINKKLLAENNVLKSESKELGIQNRNFKEKIKEHDKMLKKEQDNLNEQKEKITKEIEELNLYKEKIKKEIQPIEAYTITIVIVNKDNIDLTVTGSMSIGEVIAKIAEKVGCAAEDVSLTYMGNKLEPTITLECYDIRSDDNVFASINTKNKLPVYTSYEPFPVQLVFSATNRKTMDVKPSFIKQDIINEAYHQKYIADSNINNWFVVIAGKQLYDTTTLGELELKTNQEINISRKNRCEECGKHKIVDKEIDGIYEEKESYEVKENYENILYSFYSKDGECLLFNIDTAKASITKFESNADTWCSGSCKIKDKIYCAGGYQSTLKKYLIKYEEYEIVKDLKLERKELISLNNPICGNTLVSLNNTIIYSIGGNNGYYVSEVWKYDVKKNKWSQSKNLNEGKWLVTAIVLQNKFIYSIGGQSAKNDYGIEKLDAYSENNWETINFNNFPSEFLSSGFHYNPAAKIKDDEFIIFGSTAIIDINIRTETCSTLYKYECLQENDNQNEMICKKGIICRIFKHYPKVECFNIEMKEYDEEIPIKY